MKLAASIAANRDEGKLITKVSYVIQPKLPEQVVDAIRAFVNEIDGRFPRKEPTFEIFVRRVESGPAFSVRLHQVSVLRNPYR